MHADLKWLAENVSEWGGTYSFKHIFLEDGEADYSSVPDVVLRTFTRAQWQAAREHLGLVTTGTEDEAFDAIAKKEKAFIDSSGYRWRSDITAYDPPGPTSIPEYTYTTPDEEEAWREVEKKINPVWQSPHDFGGVCVFHGCRYAAHEQCPMCVLSGEAAKDEAWAEAERRMDAIAQNGNDGLHYNPEDVAFVRAEGKQPRYQDATGEDWIDEAARTFTAEEFRGAMRFSIGKYNRRMGKKDDLISEIEKMRDYCNRWLEVEQGQ